MKSARPVVSDACVLICFESRGLSRHCLGSFLSFLRTQSDFTHRKANSLSATDRAEACFKQLCHHEAVGIWSKAFRLTAMSLLLVIAGAVVACDVLQSDNCYISSHSPDSDRNSGDGSGDNCVCCCQHVAVTQPLVLEPQEVTVPAPPEEIIEHPLVVPSYIDHPPRLS